MRRTLRFRCDVGWDNMQPLPGGRRHCPRCDRPVHDLTRYTLREAERFRKEHPDACVHVVARRDTQELVFRPERRVRLPIAGAVVAAALSVGCGDTDASSLADPASVEAPLGPPSEHAAAEIEIVEAPHAVEVAPPPPPIVEAAPPAPVEPAAAPEETASAQEAPDRACPPTTAARDARRNRAASRHDDATTAAPSRQPQHVFTTAEIIDGGW